STSRSDGSAGAPFRRPRVVHPRARSWMGARQESSMLRDTTARLEIAGGTVTGRIHALSGKPNQDAHAWVADDEIVVAAVCDGCGSGAHSEVGARLGARLVTARLAARLAGGATPDAPELYAAAGDEVLDRLRELAAAMGGDLAQTVTEHFLF